MKSPLVSWALFALAVASLRAATPPNVVFILADDWGWGDLSAHGNPLVKTPHLDGLVRDGMEFRQFNTTSPVCSPSRVGFMTGNFPARFGIHEAIGPAAKNRRCDRWTGWIRKPRRCRGCSGIPAT